MGLAAESCVQARKRCGLLASRASSAACAGLAAAVFAAAAAPVPLPVPTSAAFAAFAWADFAAVALLDEASEEAIAAGGSTLRDYRSADGALGYFQHSFKVYGREDGPCQSPRCKGVVRRLVQGGRSTFFCPACQR